MIVIMNSAGVKEKAIEPLNKFAGTLKTLPGNMFIILTGKITFITDRLLNRFPAEKRRFILLGFGGAFLILLITGILIANNGRQKKGASPEMNAGPVIPADELFIPGEPDFVPEYLPEREPRLSWSLEEIRPYWKSPENTELWRGEIKSAIDNLMEGVP
jgi:hypothetical protein